MAEIHIGTHNNEILSYCDFIYNMYVKRDEKTYWMCRQRKCPARATSQIIDGELEVEVTRQHTHVAQPILVAIFRLKSNLRKRAVEDCEIDPHFLVTEEISKLSEEVKAALPQSRNLRQLVRNCREFLQPNLVEALIPETYTRTISGKQFLLHDNIINNKVDQTSQRTIIFATQDNLRWLFASSVWYVDGTFGIEDTVFLQIWTILGKVEECVLPLAYILMQTQREEEYLGALVTLQQKAAKLEAFYQNPSRIMVDLSREGVNAVVSAFPQSNVCMSLFQFKQSLYSEMQVLGVQASYTGTAKEWLWSAIGLAYLPPEDVVGAFDLLRKDAQNDAELRMVGLAEVADYLDRNYIRGEVDPSSLQLQPLRYPIEMWNIYKRTLASEVVDDTVVEDWYSKFGKTICHSSGPLESLVDALRNEQEHTEACVTKLSAGINNVQQTLGRKRMTKIDRVRECVMGYQEFKSAGKVLQYLTTMGSYNVLPMM